MKVALIASPTSAPWQRACLAANGHAVRGVDVDAAKVDEINAGTPGC